MAPWLSVLGQGGGISLNETLSTGWSYSRQFSWHILTGTMCLCFCNIRNILTISGGYIFQHMGRQEMTFIIQGVVNKLRMLRRVFHTSFAFLCFSIGYGGSNIQGHSQGQGRWQEGRRNAIHGMLLKFQFS